MHVQLQRPVGADLESTSGRLCADLGPQTWDNFGRAEDAITPLTDHLEDEYQRNQIFLETVANNAFKTALEYFPNEHFLRWIFGWMVSVPPSQMIV